jgi:hypothetical protein
MCHPERSEACPTRSGGDPMLWRKTIDNTCNTAYQSQHQSTCHPERSEGSYVMAGPHHSINHSFSCRRFSDQWKCVDSKDHHCSVCTTPDTQHLLIADPQPGTTVAIQPNRQTPARCSHCAPVPPERQRRDPALFGQAKRAKGYFKEPVLIQCCSRQGTANPFTPWPGTRANMRTKTNYPHSSKTGQTTAKPAGRKAGVRMAEQ